MIIEAGLLLLQPRPLALLQILEPRLGLEPTGLFRSLQKEQGVFYFGFVFGITSRRCNDTRHDQD
jgi:hypothetical protein